MTRNLSNLAFKSVLLTLAALVPVASCGANDTASPTIPTPVAQSTSASTGEDDEYPVLAPIHVRKNIGVIAKYRFDIILDYEGHRAQVNQEIDITNPGPDVWTEIVFHIPVDLRTERFTLSEIKLKEQVQTLTSQLRFSDDNFLTISLPSDVKPHESRLVNIRYGLDANSTELESRRPLGDVGYNKNLIQFTNWYPQLAPYQPGRGWVIWETIDVGPPLMAEVADYELEIKAPQGVTVASGGPIDHINNTWKFMVQNARSIAFSASPEYQVRTQTTEGSQIFIYHLSGNVAEAEAVLTAASQSLTLFNDRFGPYPYDSLVIAQNAYLPSVATGGFILHTGLGFEEYSGHPSNLLVVLVPLTMSQLWWGQVVGHNPVSEPWLGAAIPMYAEYLFDESYYPNMTGWYWTHRIDYWNPEGPVNQTSYDLQTTTSLLQDVYRQGARFLHAVRSSIGDESFAAFLQDLYAHGAFRILTSEDFFGTLRRHTDRDMGPIIDQYFDAAIVMPTLAPTLTPVFTPAPSPSPTPPLRTHIVQEGETLSWIASQYDVPTQSIIKRNHIADPATIRPGQELMIPYQ